MILRAILILFSILMITEVQSEICGQRSSITGTIFGGQASKKNSWPWLVALVYRKNDRFFCAGSLLTSKHVLSAAHCFQNKGQPQATPPEYVAAWLGKHDLDVPDEYGSKKVLVWEIIIHPDWKFNEQRFDADISMVVLQDFIEFTNEIVPVCLPRPTYNEITGYGIVVGWGRSENTGEHRHDSTLSQLIIPAVNASHCYTTFNTLASYSSNRAFCGGYANSGQAPCLGDSGGGYYFRDSGVWVARGIISAAIIDFDLGCDINKYSIYTNVARFIEWIQKTIRSTWEVTWENLEYSCEDSDDSFISVDADCYIVHNQPFERNKKIHPSFTNHTTRKNYTEIRNLVIFTGTSIRIPLGIGEAFPNLVLLIVHDKSVKFFDRLTFVNMTKLKSLELSNKKINFIAEDSFWDLEKLEFLSLFDCGIVELPARIFEKLINVERIIMGFNKFEVLPKDIFKNNMKLWHVDIRNCRLKTIEVDFTLFPNMREINVEQNDCIDKVYSQRAPEFSVESVRALQDIIDAKCTGNSSNGKIFEPWINNSDLEGLKSWRLLRYFANDN